MSSLDNRRNEESRDRQVESLKRLLGPLLPILDDASVTDINLNPDGWYWVTRLGQDKERAGQMGPGQAESLIAAVAGTLGMVATRATPIVEGKLITDGSRFEGFMPPFVAAACFSIRKPASRVFPLAHYVERGLMTQSQLDRIERAVVRRDNIIVTGGTGSGKTTLLNAVIEAITRLTPHHRLMVIEETPELQVNAPDSISVQTSEAVTTEQALRAALRSFPDRILVGEVRGPEARDLLMAWNTGHDGGAASLHSNIASPSAALTRLETLVAFKMSAHMQTLIAEAVGLIVCLERTKDDAGQTIRRVAQIVSVEGFDGRGYQLKTEG